LCSKQQRLHVVRRERQLFVDEADLERRREHRVQA
jgi:hypothetical protein